MKTKNIIHLAFFSLALTLILGVFLRWTHAGFFSDWATLFDFRRAHSHIGFYAFLFPLIWSVLGKKNIWVPRGLSFVIYFSLSFLAIMSFLIYSYEWPSKLLSFLVYLFWLAFALKNVRNSSIKGTWLCHIVIGIFFSTLSIASIVVSGILGEEEMARSMVRLFLTFLVWGVFVPFALYKRSFVFSSPFLWFSAVFVTGLFVLELFPFYFVFWGPAFLGLLVVYTVLKTSSNDIRIRAYWLLITIGLFLLSFRVIENSHIIAVAAFHLMLLGPILLSIFSIKNEALAIFYDLMLLAMVSSIGFLHLYPTYYSLWQKLAASSGTLLASVLLFTLIQNRKNLKEI